MATGLVAACSVTPEPSEAELRATLEEHRSVLDELRVMFEQDRAAHELSWVTPGGMNDARCGKRRDRRECLAPSRSRAYARRLRRAGIDHLETMATPGIYFEMHRADPPRFFHFGGPFRYRGLVYAPGIPNVVHPYDDTEERVDLGGGWYAYLIIDD